MTLIQVTRNYVRCPHCEENSGSTIDHLMEEHAERSWGPWYCDECGYPFSGTVTAEGGVTVGKAQSESRFVKYFNLLCLPPQKEAVYFIVAGRHPEGRAFEGTQFFYESHSCPTNWLEDIAMISIGANQDPHGLLKYWGSAPFDQERMDGCNVDWREIFPIIDPGVHS